MGNLELTETMVSKAENKQALPEGWREVSLMDVGSTFSGLHGKTKKDFGRGKFFITYLNIYKNISINLLELGQCIINENDNQNAVMKGDVFFTTSSETPDEVGISSVLLEDIDECYLNSFCFGWRRNQHGNKILSTDYLMHFFRSQIFRRQVFMLAQGATRYNLSKTQFMKTWIAYPNIIEQKAIASLLEKWDTAIEKTEALIAAKEKQFRWLLKTLISDQQDNPEWREVRLGEIGEISSAGVDKKIMEGQVSVRLVNYLDALRRDFIFSNELDHWVTAPKRKAIQCDVKKGDVFFTPSSEIQGDIAHSAVAVEDIDKAVYSYHIIRFRLKQDWDIKFRAYAFKSSHFYKQAYRLCEGSGQRYVISQNYFRNMTIFFPDLKTQRKIGQTLSVAQDKITLLKQLAEQYRTQKRGLMQKLLTGEWRVH